MDGDGLRPTSPPCARRWGLWPPSPRRPRDPGGDGSADLPAQDRARRKATRRLCAHAADAAPAHRGGVSLAAPATLHAAKGRQGEKSGRVSLAPASAGRSFPLLPDVYNPREGSAGPARIGCWKLEEFSIADRRGSAGRALGRQSADRRALRDEACERSERRALRRLAQHAVRSQVACDPSR